MTEERTPISLDDLAGEHDWHVASLRDLVEHIEEYAINDLDPAGSGVHTITALAFVAKELAVKVAKEAEDLNPNSTMPGYKLMAMPAPLPDYVDGRQQVRECLAVVTDQEATREDLTSALERADKLVDQDDDFTPDLESLVRVVEMRGYAVGWLTSLGQRRPHLTPSQGMAKRRPALEDDIRACLSAEEIERGARAFSFGLEGYLVSVLSRPARGQEEEEATPA